MSLDQQGFDNRQNLYNRFVTELDSGSLSYYDEDELVELYDYAGDIGDRRIAFEVLVTGLGRYPASVPLAERKAVFYMTYDDEGARKAIASLPADNVIGRLLSLRLSPPDRSKAESCLDTIVSTAGSLTDEEILQLTDTVADLKMEDWLRANKSRIAALTDYPQTLYYEMMQMSLEDSDPDTALATLEDLTLMEPFNIDFWLAEAQIMALQKQNPEQALGALEYALAIDPDNARALMMKAQCYSELGYPHEQINMILEQVMATSPDLEAPYLAEALLLVETQPDKARSMLDSYLRNHPGSRQTLDVLLTISDASIDQQLIETEMRDNYTRAYADEFVDMAQRHSEDGRHGAAARLLLAVDRVFGLTDNADFLIEELYRAGLYQELIDVYVVHYGAEGIGSQRIDRFSALFYILARLRTGDRNVSGMITQLIMTVPMGVELSLEEHMAQMGLLKHLLRLQLYLGNPAVTDESVLDPFAT